MVEPVIITLYNSVMNPQRLRKQAIYAALFGFFWLSIIGLPVILISQSSVPRATPTVVPSTTPQPIDIQSVDVIRHERSIDVVARVYNPNPRAGIVNYVATFILWDNNNQEISQTTVASHILPGSLQYIAALNIPTDTPISKVTLKTPENPHYAQVPANISLPSFSTFLRDQTQKSVGGQTITEQKGVVTNSSSLTWQHVEVATLALNAAGRPVGVSTTFVGRLTSGEQREFTAQWPTSSEPISRVVTLATTNIFKEDNIIRAVGDPALLR